MWELWISLLCVMNIVVIVWCCTKESLPRLHADKQTDIVMYLVNKNHALFNENQMLKRKLGMKDS